MRERLMQFYTMFIYLFLFAPIIVLVLYSFNQSASGSQWTGFTLDWYDKLFKDEALGEAVENTVIVAMVSTLLSTVIGTLAAFAMHRYQFPGRKLMDLVFYMPVIIPEIVMAVSLLTFFVLIDFTLGRTSIIIGHVAFCISFVVIVVRARLHGFDDSLLEAASDLGADPTRTFLYVTFPLILPGVIAAALLSFTMSLDDFLITHFTAGVGSTTLPLKIYSMVRFGITPEINAVSTLMLFVTVVMILISQRLQRTIR
jgi:spermidine/putrescine transport system permease protein